MRQPYARQHYVPQFLLRQWHSGHDDMLTVHQRLRGEFLHKRAAARQVGFKLHLYSARKPGGHMDTSLERDFMGPYVDAPAAVAHRAILSGGVRSLNEAQRGYWAQFMVSLMIRGPRTMALLHEKAREVLGQQLDDDPDFARQYDSTTTTREWVEKHWPEAYSEVAIGVLPQLIQSENLLNAMIRGKWATRVLASTCPFDFLIGDHPLLNVGSFDSTFLVAIPLSPRCAFLYFGDANTWDQIHNQSDAQFARAMNMETVATASRYVFASDNRHLGFVQKHLRDTPHN